MIALFKIVNDKLKLISINFNFFLKKYVLEEILSKYHAKIVFKSSIVFSFQITIILWNKLLHNVIVFWLIPLQKISKFLLGKFSKNQK